MESTDWAVVWATAIGPVVAVAITLWYQGWSARRLARRDLFASLMRHRRSPTDREFVGALNLIPVHFSGKQKVLDRLRNLMATFEDPTWRSADHEAIRRLTDKSDTNVAYLLSEISSHVGAKIEQLEILRGAYQPQGWSDALNAQNAIQSELLAVLQGRPLGVHLVAAAEPPQQEAD